jgi:hypothetical protein
VSILLLATRHAGGHGHSHRGIPSCLEAAHSASLKNGVF